MSGEQNPGEQPATEGPTGNTRPNWTYVLLAIAGIGLFLVWCF